MKKTRNNIKIKEDHKILSKNQMKKQKKFLYQIMHPNINLATNIFSKELQVYNPIRNMIKRSISTQYHLVHYLKYVFQLFKDLTPILKTIDK